MVNHDPPILTVGFSGATGIKDTAANILATGECTVNIISEWFIEAANYTSIPTPRHVSEWELSGLTPVDGDVVKAPRVAESAFAIECKLVTSHEWKNKTTGKHTGTMVILEGVRFHVREDAINEQKNIIDASVLKPISRLGGVTYGVVREGFELVRPNVGPECEKSELVKRVVEEADRKKAEEEKA